MSNNSNDYRTRVTYEILDGQGNVMDSLIDELNWPQTAEQAMLHKYLFMGKIFGCQLGDEEPEMMGVARRVMAAG